MAQKPGTARNVALAALAGVGAVVDAAAPAAPGVSLTGRVYNLGGGVEAVLVDSWAVVDGRTVFRGDVVRADADFLDSHPGFRVLGTS